MCSPIREAFVTKVVAVLSLASTIDIYLLFRFNIKLIINKTHSAPRVDIDRLVDVFRSLYYFLTLTRFERVFASLSILPVKNLTQFAAICARETFLCTK